MSMTLRLDDAQDAALTALAASQGISKNEAAIRAIQAAADRDHREAAIEAAISDTVTRYATTLERLGQ
jgi:predicted transcriptional regulator